MSKREKIIVGFMVVAILYGGFNFLFPDSKGGRAKYAAQQAVAVTDFVTDLVRRIRAADTTATDVLILEKSATPWRKDPFEIVSQAVVEDSKPNEDAEIVDREELAGAFSYTGYMEMGDSILAIINGLEYQVGDQLASEGAVLKKATPAEVLIYVDSEKGLIVVPIVEAAQP